MGAVNILKLLVAIAIPLFGSAFVNIVIFRVDWKSSRQWVKTLKKSPWSPPSWVFGPVWTTLYILMGVSSYLVVKEQGGVLNSGLPILMYATNLLFNFLWSPLCFGYKRISLALIDIILTYITAILTAVLFYNVRPLAGILLVPLCAWLTIATTLNYYLAKNNPQYS